MADHDDQFPTRRSGDDRAAIEPLVAQCIEAMERGEPDPAPTVCAARPDLLVAVRRRLAQLVQRGLLATPPGAEQRIGDYRIVRELGSGGMGTVYLAEQQQPVRRQVALKVIKLGMDTRDVVARFEAERQALALMNHPHIAQVFDAGITADGRPFFVMEHVAGHDLNGFCDARRLGTEGRVRLLATVCRAVQHAHDRGFIHRDLKPSNVLVAEIDGQFVPKVIDFGIAKAAAGAVLADGGARTRIDQVLGTPEYMSPEHASSGGLDVDTRADVWALGVVLYELLCGELPFDPQRLRRASWQEFTRMIRDELPTLPSKRLSLVGEAALLARGGERFSLQRRVAGDLDWITLKALAKEREQRYPSALALAEDLERWLAHEPVLAAPPGRGYRLRKFARRHRVAVGAATAVLVALVVGLTVSLRATFAAERARAQEAALRVDTQAFYDLARDSIGTFVEIADRQLAEVPQAEEVRRRLLADALTFYEGLRARRPQDVGLRIDMASATRHIGRLQLRLGAPQEAVETLRRGADELAALQREAPAERQLLRLAVELHSDLSNSLRAAGRLGEALVALRDALAAVAAARDAGAIDVAAADLNEGKLLANMATLDDAGPQQAVVWFERSLAAFARVAQLDAQDQATRATAAARYAEALTRLDRLADAAAALTAAIAAVSDAPGDAGMELRAALAELASQTAEVERRLQHREAALTAQRRAVAGFDALARDYPQQVTFVDGAASGHHALAQLLLDGADPAGALESVKRAVAIRQGLVAAHAQNHRAASRLTRSLMLQSSIEFAIWQHQGGEREPAVATLRLATEVADRLFATNGGDLEALRVFAASHVGLGSLLASEGRFDDALAELERVRSSLELSRREHADDAELRSLAASRAINALKVHYQRGDFDAAAAAGQEGFAQVAEGLRLDARQSELREHAVELGLLTAIVQLRRGDGDGAARQLFAMCDDEALGADGHEQACLMFGRLDGDEYGDAAKRRELQQRAVACTRAAIAARGTVEAALQRPAQRGGMSASGSRLRDLDLRLVLGDLLRSLGTDDGHAPLLDEAERIAASMPEVGVDRLRNLHDQRAVLQLEKGDASGAAATIAALLDRAGDDGGANYLAAVLLTRCATTDDVADADRERWSARAVTCLGAAIAAGTVPPAAVRSESFVALRGRDDFAALQQR